MIGWGKTTKEEFVVIAKIANRAKAEGHPDDILTINMDIEATHQNMGLKLKELLNVPAGDFLHDVFGIRQHIDRTTGKLMDFFVPRYSNDPERRGR